MTSETLNYAGVYCRSHWSPPVAAGCCGSRWSSCVAPPPELLAARHCCTHDCSSWLPAGEGAGACIKIEEEGKRRDGRGRESSAGEGREKRGAPVAAVGRSCWPEWPDCCRAPLQVLLLRRLLVDCCCCVRRRGERRGGCCSLWPRVAGCCWRGSQAATMMAFAGKNGGEEERKGEGRRMERKRRAENEKYF